VTSDAQQYVTGVAGLDITSPSPPKPRSSSRTARWMPRSWAAATARVLGDRRVRRSLDVADVAVADAEGRGARSRERDDWIGYIAAIGFGVVFLIAAQTFGATIAQSVVEEKQTRVVELLISAIPTRALLAGKVIGNTVLAMGQMLILAAIAVVGLTVTGQTTFLEGIGAPIAWFASSSSSGSCSSRPCSRRPRRWSRVRRTSDRRRRRSCSSSSRRTSWSSSSGTTRRS
jgi:ABC-2 type transport system permease protein